MTNEQRVLLALVRAGLITNRKDKATDSGDLVLSAFMSSAKAGFDPVVLQNEAKTQGVIGVAWAGYERLHAILPEDCQLPASVKLSWFAAASGVEAQMKRRFALAADFAELLHKEAGLRLVVLKGIDYARLYPRPAYREFGDLDCWLVGEADKGDEIARRVGAYGDRGDYKHSHLHYKGLIIENHRYFTSHSFTARGLHTEKLLSDFMMERELEPIGRSLLFSPPPAFTAIFMLRHACGHFLAEGVRLRFVTDWMLFLQQHAKTLRREDVWQALRETRLLPFARLLTAFCERHLGLEPGLFPIDGLNQHQLTTFTDDLFSAHPSLTDRSTRAVALRILRRFRRMWRFRAFLDEAYLLSVKNTFKFSDFLKERCGRGANS